MGARQVNEHQLKFKVLCSDCKSQESYTPKGLITLGTDMTKTEPRKRIYFRCHHVYGD